MTDPASMLITANPYTFLPIKKDSIKGVETMANDKQDAPTDDGLLMMLLTLVEEDGVELEVTLNVKGAVVTGNLIGASAYYEGIINSSKQYQDNTLAKIVSKKFSDMKEAYVKQKEDDKENGGNNPTFIHLKNVAYQSFNNNQQTTTTTTGGEEGFHLLTVFLLVT